MSRTVHYDTNENEVDTEDCINDAPTYAQEQLADVERREAVNHPDYYKRGGVEAIDASSTLPAPGARRKTACKTSKKQNGT